MLNIITLWSTDKGAIPDGWHLCDGTDGTPLIPDAYPLDPADFDWSAFTGLLNVSGGVLSAFHSSSDLASIIDDETGSGLLVFNVSPILITPSIDDALATSIQIGANILDTSEWGFLDGQDQGVRMSDSPAFIDLLVAGELVVASSMSLNAGSITDATGAIIFDNENLATTGALTIGSSTVTSLSSFTGISFPPLLCRRVVNGVGTLGVMSLDRRTSSGVAPNLFGAGLYFRLTDGGGTHDDYAGFFGARWYSATAGSEQGEIIFTPAKDNNDPFDDIPALIIRARQAGGLKSTIIDSWGQIILSEGGNMIFGTVTGSKIGTVSTQKMGFWGVIPVIQRAHIIDADGTLLDITTKFNNLLLKLETIGLLASA